MATTRKPRLCFFLTFAVLFAVVLPAINTHAVRRHNTGSFTAYDFVEKFGLPGDKHECDDGRTRYVCDMGIGKKGKQLFAVVVVAGGYLVTAFICRPGYAKVIRQGRKKEN